MDAGRIIKVTDTRIDACVNGHGFSITGLYNWQSAVPFLSRFCFFVLAASRPERHPR